MAEKKMILYCGHKGSLYEGPCYYAQYDRLFELGCKTCKREEGSCPHQKKKGEEALRKAWITKCTPKEEK